MIVKCPACDARFRLNREKLGGKRLKLRCPLCRALFRVELPHSAPRPPVENAVRVMVAHSDHELCHTIQKIVLDAGMECVLGHSGDEVLALMQAKPPQVAIVDVALQGLYAFEVVEKVRRRPGLANVKIILLSSVYNKAAYKRSPNSLYGADDYIEKHHIPDDLVLKINRLSVGIDVNPGPAKNGEIEAPSQQLSQPNGMAQDLDFIQSVNLKIKSAEDHEISGDDAPERERAKRLARIIVSDVSLYYQDKIDEGILRGNWSDLLAGEIKEARGLFRERFPSEEIQQGKILEAAFLDLLEKRRKELNA
ncbi:MAG: zinc-ribbon domain-containing protein [Desulfuromonadales bacterium]|nr:zinc-ribbon domain-containing protein [Desulfuromonadales bacterium]